MITENLSTLKIHKLTQEQYDRELEAGRIDPSALYLTPDDSSIYIQSEEPLDASDGALWVDLDADGSNINIGSGSNSGDGSGVTNVDLSKYALKTEIPKKTSQLTNDSNYITRAEVVSYIEESILGGVW